MTRTYAKMCRRLMPQGDDFLAGALSVFDLGAVNFTVDLRLPDIEPIKLRKHLTRRGLEADAQSIAGDWQRIGQDFTIAIRFGGSPPNLETAHRGQLDGQQRA